MNQPLYILQIIDEGFSQRTIPDYDMERFLHSAALAITKYLELYGYKTAEDQELRTEDGYAKVIVAHVDDHDAEETIWSYPFDGEMRSDLAIQQLRDQIVIHQGIRAYCLLGI
ncbi:hypothetical protein [Paenibacillus agilis]|uniref:Uncharacterized protein n=1 Tax=Paenibacillus agilis TaxID=3020863 RepID=A0A559ID03_9BACL|nr:hypothetical protein [Paenibacillus agilis]TVX85549.1 hypothetical protein FPZ44_24645 [Paenibacillus agilis]